jgi:uncharacterized OsmC-like protein
MNWPDRCCRRKRRSAWITKIRLRYRFRIPAGTREKIERVLDSYADHCPAYQSVKGCIACTWEAAIEEII